MSKLLSYARYTLFAIVATGLLACGAEAEKSAEPKAQADKTQSSTQAPAKKGSTIFGPQYIEGEHYQVLEKPVEKINKDKPEVVEVFWYGCIHCFHLEPYVKAWKKTIPSDVEFVPTPAVWNPTLGLHAKIYYTLKEMGLLEKMHDKVFNAMNSKENKRRFTTEGEIADFMGANGVNREQFLKAFNSFPVNSQLETGTKRVQQYKINGTPEIIVNGKYKTSPKMAGSQEGAFKVTEYLLGLE